MTQPTRKVKDLTLLGDIADGDKLVAERTDGTTVRVTYVSSGAGVTDGDKGDITVSSSGATWNIDTPAVVTVATDDKVLIKDTSGSDAFKYVTAQSIADLGGGGVSDGDYGDITVSGSNTVWTIDNGAVTLAKQADMATASVVYRKTAGSGAPEVNTLATLKTDLGLTGTNSGDQTITLTGDVTGSGTGSFAAMIANDAVSYAKMQNVSATDMLLGRSTIGSGDVEEITCTAAGRALLDDADASAQRTTLGLGTLATQSGTFSGTSSGTNTGDQTSIVGITGTKAQFDTAVTDGNILYVGDVTQYTDELAQDAVGAMVDTTLTYVDGTPLLQRAALTGDVTASAGSNATTIANDAVTYAKMQNVSATDKLLGRSSALAGDVEEIACTAAGRAILDDASASDQRTTLGLVIGTNVQAYDAELAALAGLASAANKLPYFTGSGTAALADLSSAMRTFLTTSSSANLASVLTDETGSGAVVFSNAPTMTGALNMGSNLISAVTDPSSAQDAATKNYVDSVVAGLNPNEAANYASTANLTVTYSNGVSGVGATLTNAGAQATFSLDGGSPSVGQRILIKNQSSGFQNGIYDVTSVGSGATNWVLTRSSDYNTIAAINNSGLIPIISGTANAGTGWLETSTIAIIGTDDLVFTQFGQTAGTIPVASGGTGRTSDTAYAPIVGGTTSTSALQSTASGSTGQIFQSAGNAAVPTWSTPTYPSTSGTSRKILVSDGTNNVYSTETYAVPGTSGNVLTSDGTNWTSAAATGGGINQNAYTTTATAAGTTTLTVSSTYQQYFTGTTTQTVTLPVTSTLALGQAFMVVNNSTGIVTVQSSGGNTVAAITGASMVLVTCILTSGTSAASWDYRILPHLSGMTGTGNLVRATSPTLVTPALGTPASGNSTNLVVETAEAYKSAVQAVTTATVTTVTWDLENWDNSTLHDNVTNNSRMTAATTGLYFIAASLTWGGSNTGVRQIFIYKNGSFISQQTIDSLISDDSAIYKVISLTAGDYIEIKGYHAHGSNLNIDVAGTLFSMTKLGKVS